jgi:xanthine dehydrogenase YagR molybdenum-binding subunit
MKCTVNGRSVDVPVHAEDTAIDVLRGPLGLTGTKLSCGAGTCGACTILADKVPVCSCLLPAADLESRQITTIETFAAGDHPIQRAFMAEDALQCGYCTPGFVIQGIAFFDAWRAVNGRLEPSAEAIADACAGHLCRCGAYQNIKRAIARACAGDYDAAPSKAPPRHDAQAKVTGAAVYTVDVCLPGQLEGRILRAPLAHADITTLDLSGAATLEGVAAVVSLTGGATRVRYVGQEIAAVAATDRHIAAQAIARITVAFDEHPAAIGLEAASKPDAPHVYASIFEHKVSQSELPLVPTLWHGNVRGPSFLMSHEVMRAESALGEAERSARPGFVKTCCRSSSQSHTPLEPHACVAHWTSDDEVEVYVSTQACSDLAIDIADRWRLPRENVRVRCEFVGGAFGAKADLTMETIAAIELSRAAQRPVRVALSNDEELVVGGYRPAVDMDLSIDVTASGVIDTISMTTHTDGGVAIGSAVAAVARFAYPDVPKWLSDYDVVSHAPPARPFRGPGGPAAFWALEQAVDAAARGQELDPVSVRRTNDSDPRTTSLLDWVETIPAWRDRHTRSTDGRMLRGIGLAMGAWASFVHSDTHVSVSAGRTGLVVSCACQDIGTGSRTVLARTVADVFGVPPEAVDVRVGDSRLPRAATSSGSRTTVSVAPAADAAARELRDRLGVAAAIRLGLSRPTIGDAGLQDGDRLVPWSEILEDAETVEVTLPRPRDPGGYVLPMALDGFLLGRARPVSAHVCEVEVDGRTGRIRVPRLWTGLAVGRVRVTALARSQAIGGAVQGVSYALYEERRLDPMTGRTLTQSLDDHRLCGLADAPEVEVHFVPGDFDSIAGGGVGLGELSTLAVAASVGNAVFDATGWRPTDLPLRIERVQGALRAHRIGGR